jgi:hypothetical protein
VLFDREPLEVTAHVADAGTVIWSGKGQRGRLFRGVVSSPPLLANQLVVVLAHGEDEVHAPKPVQAVLRAVR